MGKRSKRPGRSAPDLHTIIRDAAERLSRARAFGVRDADEVPEVAELLNAARRAIEATIPAAFDFHGRRYYLRARLALQLDVFDVPSAAAPLVRGASISTEDFGHVPGH